MGRHLNLLLIAMAVAGCGSIDKFLEGSQPADARLRLELHTSAVSITQGGEETVLATVTRVGNYSGPVAITVEALPFGVTADVGSSTTSGAVTSAPVRVRVGSDAAPGAHALRVRGHADPIPQDATVTLSVTVREPAAFALTLSQPAYTIARGGIAPATVLLSRTNYDGPVTFSLSGAPGITAVFGSNPATGGSSSMTLAVSGGVAPGSYDMTLRGTGPGLPERSVPFTITVTTDPIQLLTVSGLSVRQGSVVSADIVVNRGGYAGPVELSAENLPAGVSASFDPAAPTATSAVMTLVVQLHTAPSTYSVRVRGKGAGVPDAVLDFPMTVNPSGVALSLIPQVASLFPGSSVTATLILTRTALDAAIAISVEGAPPGVTVTAEPATVLGNSSTLTVRATGAAVPGEYSLTVRTIPEGWPPGASATVTLGVSVRAPPTGGGNVLLDWSRCAAPDWVAVQDGNGPWSVEIPEAGLVGFSVTSGRGGFAFVEAGNTVEVRYMTQAELTARTIDLCPPPPVPGPKTLTGLGVHASAGEQFSYSMGGATAISSGASPNFTLAGVREGTHDLIAWGTTSGPAGLRGFLLRDLDLPNGASVGSIDLLGPGSFAPVRPVLSVLLNFGDLVSHTMSYLTTPLCTVNPLFPGVSGTTAVMAGVPGPLQRPDDRHLLTVTALGSSRSRVVTQTFHAIAARTVTLPTLLGVPGIVSAGSSYLALRTTLNSIPPEYNGSVSLRYVSGTRAMRVSATIGYAGTSFVTIAMPDFAALPGWPNASAIGWEDHGTWSLSLDGATLPGSPCTENLRTVFFNQRGTF